MARRLTLLLAVLLMTAVLPMGLRAAGDEPAPPATHPRHWRERKPLSPEQVEAAVAVLREIQPELAPRLEAMRQADPRQVAEAIDREYPRLRHLLELRELDPTMFELRVAHIRLAYRSQALADQLRAAAGPDAAPDAAARAPQLREELAQVVGEHFDIRQRIREHELVVLERRLEQMRRQLADHAQDRDRLIQMRIAELAGEAEESVEW